MKKLSEAETLKVIDKVCKRCMNKYKIDGMTADDIYQESFIICWTRLNKYDGKRPLENFLAFSLVRRLYNIYRNVNKRKINTVDINHVSEEYLHVHEKESVQEFINIIDVVLPVDMRHDYIKYINGVFIPRVRKQRLVGKIKELADEFWSDSE